MNATLNGSPSNARAMGFKGLEEPQLHNTNVGLKASFRKIFSKINAVWRSRRDSNPRYPVKSITL